MQKLKRGKNETMHKKKVRMKLNSYKMQYKAKKSKLEPFKTRLLNLRSNKMRASKKVRLWREFRSKWKKKVKTNLNYTKKHFKSSRSNYKLFKQKLIISQMKKKRGSKKTLKLNLSWEERGCSWKIKQKAKKN